MMIVGSELNCQHLALVAEVSSAIGGLPAVATVDWCERAAKLLLRLAPCSVASVTVAELAPSGGGVTLVEASGAAVAPQAAAPADFQGVHNDDTRALGWCLEEKGPRPGPVTALLREQSCHAEWSRSVAGRRWSRAGVRDLVIGTAPVVGRSPLRRLIVELGQGAGGPTLESREADLLRAVLPILAARAALAFGPAPSNAATRLTEREQQVLDELALGKSVKEIAQDLGRSHHTVHDHVKSLHKKLEATSRGELIARALGHLAGGRKRSSSADAETGAAPAGDGGGTTAPRRIAC